MSLINKDAGYFYKNTLLSLALIGILSFVIRMYYFPYNIPVTEDGWLYFRYAIDASLLGHLPNTPLINNGWPLLLSIFFSTLHSPNFLDYVELQRLVSISISVLTIIPVYLVIRRFFVSKYALFGALMFAIEPRTMSNSLLGITEPLYIFLVTTILYLLFSGKMRTIYFSFALVAVTMQIRYEAVMLVFVNSIAFFGIFGKKRDTVVKYGLAIGLFFLVLIPMEYIRTVTYGDINNGKTAVFTGAMVYGRQASSYSDNIAYGVFQYVTNGLVALVKYLGWITIPYYVIFMPIGFYLLIKNRSTNRTITILTIAILLAPALYAYSRGIQETRYLYVLYPIFSIISVYCIKFFSEKRKEIFYVGITVVLISSILFMNYKAIDNNHEREAFEIAKYVSKYAKTVNSYYPESRYLAVSNIDNNFPVTSNLIPNGVKEVNTNFQSLTEFINSGKKEGLDYIVVDDKKDRVPYLVDLFNDDSKYPYLIKKFDSKDFGFVYHVKMYKIDYQKFASNDTRNA